MENLKRVFVLLFSVIIWGCGDVTEEDEANADALSKIESPQTTDAIPPDFGEELAQIILEQEESNIALSMNDNIGEIPLLNAMGVPVVNTAEKIKKPRRRQ